MILNDIRSKVQPFTIRYYPTSLSEDIIINDLDRSNISIISKRSHNSSKVSTRDFNKTQAKEKFGFFSQKAAINMTDNTLFGNEKKKKIIKLENNEDSLKSKTQDILFQNKTIRVIETKHYTEGKKTFFKLNNTRKINSDEQALKNFNKNENLSSVKKKSEKIIRVLNSKKVLKVDSSKNTNFENTIKNKNINKNCPNTKSINTNSDIFKYSHKISNPRLTSYKLEPKSIKKNTQTLVKTDFFENKIINTSMVEKNDYDNFLNKLLNEKILSLLCKFCSNKEQNIISCFSKDYRTKFYLLKINDINEKISIMKKNIENPFESVIIPKILEVDFIKIIKSFSILDEKIKNSIAFINLLYLVENIFNHSFTSDENLSIRIDRIENFIKQLQGMNIYSILKEFLLNLKFKKEFCINLKTNFKNNLKICDFSVLPNELTPLTDFAKMLFKILDEENSMELIIETEILLHKIEKLKSFFEL